MSFEKLENEVTSCRKCDRLVEFRQKIAQQKRKSYMN